MRTSIETESPLLCSVVYLYISGECNTDGVIYLSLPCFVNTCTFSCIKNFVGISLFHLEK